MRPGDQMNWLKVVSNYGHEVMIPVAVLKIGKRTTVEAPLKNGGARKVSVTPGRLYPLAGATRKREG